MNVRKKKKKSEGFENPNPNPNPNPNFGSRKGRRGQNEDDERLGKREKIQAVFFAEHAFSFFFFFSFF